MIKCPNCTGEMNFNPTDKVVVCEYCGSKFDPKELKAKLKTSKEVKKTEEKDGEKVEGKGYTCSQCGATLLTFDDTAITFCSYCGSQAMIEEKMMKINNPDFVIPFSKTKDDCIKAYKSKISKCLFAPNYLKSDLTLEKFRGIYIPYGIYKLEHHGDSTNKGSKYSHRSGDYQYYDDYEIKANIDATYDGLSHDLISKLYDKYSNSIPFNYKEKEEFNPNYLIGYYADSGDVDSKTYDDEIKTTAEKDSTSKLKKYKEFSKYGCYSPKTNLDVSERKTGMFPLYFLAIRNSDNKTVNYAVVNGQTGKVAADIPISFPKYIIASLLLAIVIFLIINNLLVLTPHKVIYFSIFSGILSLTYSFRQGKEIKKHESHEDDKGYKSTKKDDVKTKKTHTILFHIKEIIAIIISIVVIILNPVDDLYYYVGALISLLLVLLSFYDLVKEHNILSSNKLPQLEKRGGDNDA